MPLWKHKNMSGENKRLEGIQKMILRGQHGGGKEMEGWTIRGEGKLQWTRRRCEDKTAVGQKEPRG